MDIDPRLTKESSCVTLRKLHDPRELTTNDELVIGKGKIVFWWQGMNFYPLNPKMGIKDNFISKWF